MRFVFFTIFLLFNVQAIYANVKFLSISDIHYGTENTPGEGHDTGDILLTSAIKKFTQLSHQVNFILVLGDLPTHVLLYSPQKAGFIEKLFEALYQADEVHQPMFYITGNNDSLKGNYQPFLWNNQSPLKLAKNWQGACVYCKGLMIDSTHMEEKGYYSSYVMPGNNDILLIALNTTPFAKTNFLIPKYLNQNKDAMEELNWLKKQLKTHHAKQLLIAMHIPPGKNQNGKSLWKKAYLKRFIHLLNLTHNQFGEITLLTSHTHMDDVRKIHLNDGTSIYTYATPSISRKHYNYPAMKIFDLGKDFQLKNYTTYYTTKENLWENNSYQASVDIFPTCQKNSLSNCLNTLDKTTLCKILNQGKFYGVKNLPVDNTRCNSTYIVN